MPLFTRTVDPAAAALILTDDARTYFNIGTHYDATHRTVCHNRYFVNPERYHHFFAHLGETVPVKIHTNTIEGAWGNMKPKLRVKRGVATALQEWCHFYSFQRTFAEFLSDAVEDLVKRYVYETKA